jgi:hypothetical protein
MVFTVKIVFFSLQPLYGFHNHTTVEMKKYNLGCKNHTMAVMKKM